MIPYDVDCLHILRLKVNAGHYTPYYYVGDGQRIAFVRVGDESLPASAEQMVRLVLKGFNKTYDSLPTDTMLSRYWRMLSKIEPNKNETRSIYCRLGW